MKLLKQIILLAEDDKTDKSAVDDLMGSVDTQNVNDKVVADAPPDKPQDVNKFWKDNEGETKTFSRTRIYPVKENDDETFTLFIDADGQRNELTTFSNKANLLKKFKPLESSEHNPYSGENLQAYRKRSTVDAWLNTGDAIKLNIQGEAQLLKPGVYLVKHPSGIFTLAPQKKFDKNHEAL
jgi:hypothetical protein